MSKEAGTPAETVEKQKSTLTKILSTCYSSVMISIRPFLFSLTLSAVLMAGEIGSMNRVIVIPVPNGGEAADARITADGTIYLLYDYDADNCAPKEDPAANNTVCGRLSRVPEVNTRGSSSSTPASRAPTTRRTPRNSSRAC